MFSHITPFRIKTMISIKYQVEELEGALLDAAVAKAHGIDVVIAEDNGEMVCFSVDAWGRFQPSSDWRDGGPIIEHEGISLQPINDGWEASTVGMGDWSRTGKTPLIAAMRAYAGTKFEYFYLP
jgi:hypothetical protein